jgi:signal peptidase I
MSQSAGDGSDAADSSVAPPPPSTVTGVRPRRRFLREVPVILVTALVVSVLIKTFLVQAFFIPSGSMEPTLHGCQGCLGDRVLVNKLVSHAGGIHRGDVVVFRDSSGWLPAAPPSTGLGGLVRGGLEFVGLAPSTTEGDLIKRVIGVGGDTVEGRDGRVYVNGAPLDEPYVLSGNRPTDIDFRVTVPAGRLWVMGDHRAESADSRVHQQDPGGGFVPVADVVGRAFVIVWPLGRTAALHRPPTFDQQRLAHSG